MKILALDSTAVTASVALCEDETLIAEYTLAAGLTHSQTLLPMVESVLKLVGLCTKDIDLFACAEGPGSFTGVRIGAATIKGLAFDMDKPCIGVSTLEALAYNLAGYEGIACPVMNARRSQVYNALFKVNNKSVTRLCEDRAIAISDLEDELAEVAEPIFLSGDGYDITKKGFARVATMETPEPQRIGSGYSVAMLALAKYRDGVRTSDAELAPTYLRPCQAERERMAKERMENFEL